MSDSSMNQTTTSSRPADGYPLLSADQIRPLWDAVDEAVKNYREEDEERTGDAVIEARDRIANARTVDPLGIAYKLRATRSWRDQSKGLAEALESPDRDERTIATIIRDLEAVSAASPPTRHIPSRLRPLWEAYQRQWKKVSDATDAEDRARLAERMQNVDRGTSSAAIEAAHRLAAAKQAFEAASEALESAPTRAFDDALCRIEHAIDLADESTNADLISSLNKALRVLRKVRIEA